MEALSRILPALRSLFALWTRVVSSAVRSKTKNERRNKFYRNIHISAMTPTKAPPSIGVSFLFAHNFACHQPNQARKGYYFFLYILSVIPPHKGITPHPLPSSSGILSPYSYGVSINHEKTYCRFFPSGFFISPL